VQFTQDVRCGQQPLTVHFTDQSIPNRTITNWHWDFGDGQTSTQQNPSHQYTSVGVFDVQLIISDAIASDTVTMDDLITTQTNIAVDFTGLPNSGEVPTTVMFEPLLAVLPVITSGISVTDRQVTEMNPIHTYTSEGKYAVKLRVHLGQDACDQTDSLVKTEFIQVKQLKAAFQAVPTRGLRPLAVTFYDLSSGNPTSWQWSFGDGGSSAVQSPTHTYYSRNAFTVKLVVSNALFTDSVIYPV